MRWLLLLLFIPAIAQAAQSVISPQGGFGLGWNPKGVSTNINEQETPDSNNMINTIYGGAEKRRGSDFYISQAYSTNPVTSVYRAYGSTDATVKSVLLAVNGNRIIHSTGGTNPQWVAILSSMAFHNTKWSFTTLQNRVFMAEDSLRIPTQRYDIMTGSITGLFDSASGSESIILRAKYVLNAGDQLLLANVQLTTANSLANQASYHNSRVYYSPLFQPSSFTYQRNLFFNEEDGEEITGLSEKDGVVHVWKPSKVFGIIGENGEPYTSLAPLPLGGDMSVMTIAKGFGLFAPRSLADAGDFYIFADKAGVRFWDGTRKTRLQAEQESRVVSDKIQPVIDRCISADTWKDAVGVYYPARRWYLLSVEDPTLNPKGKQNLVLVLDLDTLSWFRFTNWDAASWAVWGGAGDSGELSYGSSSDGYVYIADKETSLNDARRELPIQDMDRAGEWIGGHPETASIVKEGTASVRLTVPTITMHSTATYMGIVRFGEWMDKRRIDKNDKFSFKVFVTSRSNLRELRVDLELNGENRNNFTSIFTSVTFSSNALTGGNTQWTTVNVSLSSFPILDSWTNLSSEDEVFADALTAFGIRFIATGTGGLNLYFDDLRIVDDTERPLNAYRWIKPFSFGSSGKKEFREAILNVDLPYDSELFIDVYKDFGSFVDRRTVDADFGREIFIGEYRGFPGLFKLDSVTFEPSISTVARNISSFSIGSIAVDENYAYCADQYNNRLIKLDKSTFTTFVSSYGTLGAGPTNFNLINQISMDKDNLYIADTDNQRVKVHRKSDLSFLRQFGTLGQNATSFHNPMGVAVDGDAGNLYVANDGNSNILMLDKETGALKISAALEMDTFGEPSLALDDKNLYVAFRTLNPSSIEHTILVLERRDKSSLEILDKKVIYPEFSVAVGTYVYEGDISVSGDFIYLAFTDDSNENGSWYLQKRLKSDFSLVKEAIFTERIGTVGVNDLNFRPSRRTLRESLGSSGTYVQLKFSDGDSLDNSFKLYNMAYKLIPEETR